MWKLLHNKIVFTLKYKFQKYKFSFIFQNYLAGWLATAWHWNFKTSQHAFVRTAKFSSIMVCANSRDGDRRKTKTYAGTYLYKYMKIAFIVDHSTFLVHIRSDDTLKVNTLLTNCNWSRPSFPYFSLFHFSQILDKASQKSKIKPIGVYRKY